MKILDAGGGSGAPCLLKGDITTMDMHNADIIHDLENTPYPFEKSSFNYIWCHNTLEHVKDVLKVMNEFHRILKPGGILEIHVPHISYLAQTFGHIMHFSQFATPSFFCISENAPASESYTDKRWKLLETKILFNAHDSTWKNRGIKGFLIKNWGKMVNKISQTNPNFYERFGYILLGASEEIVYKMSPSK